MYGLSHHTISQLQPVQNSAAGLIAQTIKFDHISPVFRQLVCLPVSQCIIFKILILTNRALHGLSPSYVTDLLTPDVPARTLRSAGGNLLPVPQSRLRSYMVTKGLPMRLQHLEQPSTKRSKVLTRWMLSRGCLRTTYLQVRCNSSRDSDYASLTALTNTYMYVPA